ncbi:unnamed protein product [Phytophthora fragariaefolia]|uniref:Unnamed protein product n=1 Tax=Phytophthora fragariaefolia TaxID=1490495 RepID=A0A9W6X6L4_9STRA|nr:unnamed protein product [Phytophthora fragariaefolia]
MRALVMGAVNDWRTKILLDTGANISAVSESFARKPRLRRSVSLDKKIDIQGIAKDKVYTQEQTKVKLTLGWELVYESEVWIMPHYAGMDVILGTDFMIPAGVRLDLFRPNDALEVPPGSVVEFKLQRNCPSWITHDLWVRRTNNLVPTVRFDRSGRPSRVKVTNVSDRRVWCPAHFIFVWWVPNDDLPLDDGYVQMHTRKYRDWQLLAFVAATDGQLSDKERLLSRPLDAPHGPTCEDQWKQLDELMGTDDGTENGVIDEVSSNQADSSLSEEVNASGCPLDPREHEDPLHDKHRAWEPGEIGRRMKELTRRLRSTFLLINVAYRHCSSFLWCKQGKRPLQDYIMELQNLEEAMASAPLSDDVKVAVFIDGARPGADGALPTPTEDVQRGGTHYHVGR